MTKPAETLQAAAERYGDAKLALEHWQGPATGQAWANAVGEFTAAMRALNAAACGFATSTRAKRDENTEEEAA
jgi:hypothetical protein